MSISAWDMMRDCVSSSVESDRARLGSLIVSLVQGREEVETNQIESLTSRILKAYELLEDHAYLTRDALDRKYPGLMDCLRGGGCS